MLEKINFYYLSLALFNIILAQTSLKALDISGLNKEIKRSTIKKITIIDHRANFSFRPSTNDLLSQTLEIATKKMTKEEFMNSKFVKYDVDSIHENVSEKDFMTFTKTLFLFPNTNPDYFSIERVSSEEYCKVAFDDKKRKKVNETKVISEKKYLSKK